MGCENSVKNSCGWYLSNSDKLLLLPDKEPRWLSVLSQQRRRNFKNTTEKQIDEVNKQTNVGSVCKGYATFEGQ